MTDDPRSDDPTQGPWVGPPRPAEGASLREATPVRAGLHDVSPALVRPVGADQVAERRAEQFDDDATFRLLRRVLPPSLVGFLEDL